jgi:hypothetical protein
MDRIELIQQLTDVFARFERPESLVVHSDLECLDCREVDKELAETTCTSILTTGLPKFDRFPMDCLNAYAVLHYLPAIGQQALGSDGITISETLAWMFGADEWDTELTISQIILPLLGTVESDCIWKLLTSLSQIDMSPMHREYLDSAISIWAHSKD